MSNQLVGGVYQSIINEVIDSSRIDFEEAGVNASTLDDLRQVWQSRLSDMKVAQFPWDPPAPEPVQPTPEPPKAHPQQPIKQENAAPNGYQNGGAVKIKTEPGMEQQGVYGTPIAPAQPAAGTLHDPQLAAMRAHQNIAQKFGPQQLQNRPQNGGGLVLPGMNQALPQQQQQQQQPRPATAQQNGIPQHDGADDEEDRIPIEGYGSLTRDEADNILLRRIGAAERQRAKATEELSEALRNLKTSSSTKSSKSRRRRQPRKDAYDEALDSSSAYPYPSSSVAETFPSASTPLKAAMASVPAQLDGADSEDGPEEADEDAINSDLDDPEDDEIDNEDEDEIPQIMLCMYDKVQRTKNKWKCVLKDGVLTINQKEYVFHKANGEYEW